MNFIKMELDHSYSNHLSEKVIPNSRLDSNRMLENISRIYLIKYKNLKNKKNLVILDNYSLLKWKIEFSARNVKKLNIVFRKIIY